MTSTKLLTAAVGFLAVLFVQSCSTVAVTGRKQLNFISDGELLAMSTQEYGKFLKENPVSADTSAASRVRRIGTRIQRAVEKYFSDQKMPDELKGYAWEFNLVESDQVNAWCMPGGKVVFYSAILPVCATDTGIAVVMGHEVAHAVAKHGAERMSQGLLAEMGGVALSTAVSNEPQETREMWMAAYGLGAQYGVLLPYGRTQEGEADHLGLIFMAMAGYHPGAAIGFWERMAAASGGSAPPEFMSTHPSNQTRIADIKKLLPEAMKHYTPTPP